MNDDDDVPLAFVVKSTKVASTPSPPQNGSTHHKTSEAKESGKEKDKKSKDNKKEDGKENKKEPKEGKKGKRPAEWEEIDKLTQVKPSSGKSVSWAIWFRANKTLTFFIASVVVIVGCRIAEEFSPKNWSMKDMEDPFITLGVSHTATDVEIRNVYRKLSLQLHPDKNPDAPPESHERFLAVSKAYKVLTDPVKRARWMNSENPDFTPLQSDTVSLTDKTMAEQLQPGSAWLVLAYADWSSESWDIAERWEAIGKDLGRYIQVGRINCERETALARRFGARSVPMMYAYVDGAITTFHGEPTVANVTLFVAKALADSITVIRDASAGSFLTESPDKVKALLFAPQGFVKLRMAFRAFARRHHATMDFAEVTFTAADTLRELFGVTREPSVVLVKEKGSRPLRYSGRMTYGRLSHLFAQHQFQLAPRLGSLTYRDLCGAGARGRAPCAVYLHDSAAQGDGALRAAQAAIANASAEELRAARQADPERFATAVAWVDLAQEPGLRRALGAHAVAGRVVALSAAGAGGKGAIMPYEEEKVQAGPLLEWVQGLAARDAADFDALREEVVLREEWPAWNRRAAVRRHTPQLMTLIALVACWLLWYALRNLWAEWRETRLKDRFRRTLGRTLQKQMEADRLRTDKWQAVEEANRQAAERKRAEAAEREERRQRLEAAAAEAAREAARVAEEKNKKQTAPEPPVKARPAPAPTKPKPSSAPAPAPAPAATASAARCRRRRCGRRWRGW